MTDERHDLVTSYVEAPTQTITAGGVEFAYRDLGLREGIPVIFLVHLGGGAG
jgi:hypothetical protein